MASQIEAHLGRPLAANWDEPFQRLYRDAFEADLKPVPGILEALDAIVVPTCVASSGTHERIRYTLGLTGLYSRFAGRIFGAGDVVRGKPAPDLFLHAADRMGVHPAHCAVVEDSRYGIEAARGRHACLRLCRRVDAQALARGTRNRGVPRHARASPTPRRLTEH